MILLKGVDLKSKENIFRQLLEYEPYVAVHRDLKEVMAKFMAFTVDCQVERFIKTAIHELTDLRWKEGGPDAALHMELKYHSFKKEFKKMAREGGMNK